MAKLRFIRTFHPVGQGAFYSEEFEIDRNETFKMVYDCGSSTISPLDKNGKLKKNSKLQKIIKSDLGSNKIDILFLSHFDADHVNGVELLEPKTIVIPFINPAHKWILDIVGTIIGVPELSSLFLNPRAVFRNNPKVLQVEPPSENEEETLIPHNPDPIDLDNPNQSRGDANGISRIPSGTPLYPPVGNRFWEYIPWNPYYCTFFTSFETAIKASTKLDIDKLQETDNQKHIKDNLTELTQIYHNLKPDDINNHSLQLYSGPVDMDYMERLYHRADIFHPTLYRHNWWRGYIDWRSWRLGCIYSGDIMVESSWLTKYFNFLGAKRLNGVGCVQIPHHGSVDNKGWKYVESSALDSSIICVISVGNKNNYGHPSSKVINRLLAQENEVAIVNDDSTALLMEMADIALP